MLAWARRRSRPPMRGSGPVSCVGASVCWRAARASVIGRILLPDSKRGINVPLYESKIRGPDVTQFAGNGLQLSANLAGQQTEDHRVPALTLERQLRAEHALAREPGSLGHPLGGDVVRPAGQLQPLDAEI